MVRIKDLIEFSKRELKYKSFDNEKFFNVKNLLREIFNLKEKDIILFKEKIIENKNLINKFKISIKKLKNNIPVEYILKKTYFYNNEFYINKNVLIPRNETEILVNWCLENIKDNDEIFEVGIGSGIISISIALEKRVSIDASEISKKAIYVAKKNLKKFGLNNRIRIFNTDLFPKVAKNYDYIISNPPYIDSKELKELKDKGLADPEIALNGGEKGLKIIERIVLESKKILKKQGKIVLEIGYNQKKAVKKIFNNNGFENIKFIFDYNGIERVVVAER